MTTLVFTCKTLYEFGKPYVYRGVELFSDGNGILIQHRQGKFLPALYGALATPDVLRNVTIQHFEHVLRNDINNLPSTLQSVQSLTLSYTTINQEVLRSITGSRNLTSLRLLSCNVDTASHLLQTHFSTPVQLETLKILSLQLRFRGTRIAEAQKRASEEIHSLLYALFGPALRKVDLDPPYIRLSTSSTPMIERFVHLADVLAVLPETLTHLRLRSDDIPSAPTWDAMSKRSSEDRMTAQALSNLLCRLAKLRILILPDALRSMNLRLRTGTLARLTQFSGPEELLEALLPFVGETLQYVCLSMKGWGEADEDPTSHVGAGKVVLMAFNLFTLPTVKAARFCFPFDHDFSTLSVAYDGELTSTVIPAGHALQVEEWWNHWSPEEPVRQPKIAVIVPIEQAHAFVEDAWIKDCITRSDVYLRGDSLPGLYEKYRSVRTPLQ